MSFLKRRVGLLALAAGLGLAVCAGSPAQAQVAYNGNQMIVTGTVAAVANNVVSIQTPTGLVSVPLGGTIFYANGFTTPWQSLYTGLPVEAITTSTYSYSIPYNNGYGAYDYNYYNYNNGYTGGYYDVNGVWHSYNSNGWYDGNGVWHSGHRDRDRDRDRDDEWWGQ